MRYRTVRRMIYRNRKDYEKTAKDLETALQENARKAKAGAGVSSTDNPRKTK